MLLLNGHGLDHVLQIWHSEKVPKYWIVVFNTLYKFQLTDWHEDKESYCQEKRLDIIV